MSCVTCFQLERLNGGSAAPISADSVSPAQQTQNICITFVQPWSSVEDVGPTLYKYYTNVLCLLGVHVVYYILGLKTVYVTE